MEICCAIAVPNPPAPITETFKLINSPHNCQSFIIIDIIIIYKQLMILSRILTLKLFK
jgi:hypothetical protein